MTDKKRITIYVSDREYSIIKNLADLKCTSMSKVLIGAVMFYVGREKYPDMDYNFRWSY